MARVTEARCSQLSPLSYVNTFVRSYRRLTSGPSTVSITPFLAITRLMAIAHPFPAKRATGVSRARRTGREREDPRAYLPARPLNVCRQCRIARLSLFRLIRIIPSPTRARKTRGRYGRVVSISNRVTRTRASPSTPSFSRSSLTKGLTERTHR